MKKAIMIAAMAIAVLACKKEDKKPTETEPPVKNNNVTVRIVKSDKASRAGIFLVTRDSTTHISYLSCDTLTYESTFKLALRDSDGVAFQYNCRTYFQPPLGPNVTIPCTVKFYANDVLKEATNYYGVDLR